MRRGLYVRGMPVGAGADLAAFSFHPRKVLTTGEGGMITRRPGPGAAASQPARARHHRRARRPPPRGTVVIEQYGETGFNYRMTDLQAAIDSVQLHRLDGIVARRRTLAAGYQERLARSPVSAASRIRRRNDELPVVLGRARSPGSAWIATT